MKATDFKQVLEILLREDVQFVLIGGLAANVHGTARVTYDIDVVYARNDENLNKIERALAPTAPYLRGAPPGLPFKFDAETMRRGLNFTLDTKLGDVDLLGEATGGGTYEQLFLTAELLDAFGHRVPCASIEALIRMKTAAGRPKDFEALAELEALRIHVNKPLDEP